MSQIQAITWSRFNTTNLCIEADLVGECHTFTFDKNNVNLKLPSAKMVDRTPGYDEVASLASWRENPKRPLSYRIHKIDIEITLPDTIDVPSEALVNRPNQYAYFSKEQKDVCEAITEQYEELSEQVFRYWLNIIRWATGNAFIGQVDVGQLQSGWAMYIKEFETRHDVWAGTQRITFHKEAELTKAQWRWAAEKLQHHAELPIHLKFLHDCEVYVRREQFGQAILAGAMAIETFLRHRVFGSIPQILNQKLREYIEEANISQYINKFFKDLVLDVDKAKYKTISKDLLQLMNKRNKYIHMGQLSQVDHDTCINFVKSIKTLFEIQIETIE